MTNVLRLNDILKNRAKSIYKKHAFVIEWQTFIAISIILKLATIAFSIFAGFFYFNSLFVAMLNNPFMAKVFSIIALLIIEVLTAISLSKFFKFALRLEFKTAIPILLLSIFFFGISFISSTNGLALRQSEKVDNTEILTAQYNDKILNINLLYDSQKEEIKQQINTIKANPQGWTGGKRNILLEPQLKQIDSYYVSLQKIEENRKAELNQSNASYLNDINLNSLQASNESERFYKITAFIMLLVFIINGLLIFFYSKIYNENEKELQTIEVIQNFSDNIQDKAVNLIENQIQDTFALYFSAIQGNFEKTNKPLLSSKQDNSKKIGFTNKQDLISYDTVNNDISIKDKISTISVENASKKEILTCKNCGSEFKPYNVIHAFCSKECRLNWHKQNNGFELGKFLKRKH